MAKELSQAVTALAADVSRDVEMVINHHILPAQQDMTYSEIAFILMKLTADIARGAALYAVQVKRDDKSPEEVFDFFADSLAEMIAGRKEQVLQKYRDLTNANDHG